MASQQSSPHDMAQYMSLEVFTVEKWLTRPRGTRRHFVSLALIVLLQGELVWPAWVQYVTHLSHLFTVLNSSVNFFIYLLKHPSLFLGAVRSASATALVSYRFCYTFFYLFETALVSYRFC